MAKLLATRFKALISDHVDRQDRSDIISTRVETPGNAPKTPPPVEKATATASGVGVGEAETGRLQASPPRSKEGIDPSVPSNLSNPVVQYPAPFSVAVAGRARECRFWQGQKLDAKMMAVDTETSLIVTGELPALALMTVATANTCYLIHPAQVADFVSLHWACEWVAHNAAFDFWVLVKHLNDAGRIDLAAALWDMADSNRLLDTMLLDMLLRLGVDGSSPVPRDLGTLAREMSGITEIQKDDPYRLRYGEIIGKDWATVESGFFSYAAKDPIATLLCYEQLHAAALVIAKSQAGLMWPNAPLQFGVLTEAVQVKGAIALAEIGRVGMAVNQIQLKRLDERLYGEIVKLTGELKALPETQGLFKTNRAGLVQFTKVGLPSMRKAKLLEILNRVVAENMTEIQTPILKTEDGQLSTAQEVWLPYAAKSELYASGSRCWPSANSASLLNAPGSSACALPIPCSCEPGARAAQIQIYNKCLGAAAFGSASSPPLVTCCWSLTTPILSW